MPDLTYYPESELVAVLTAEPIDRCLDYKAPIGGVMKGAVVEVPLGPRKVLGVVWGKGAGGFDLKKARAITRILDVAAFSGPFMSFLDRMAAYTMTPKTAVLRLATRAPGLLDPPSMQTVFERGQSEPDKLTDARARVLDVFDEFSGAQFMKGELAALAGVSHSVITGLEKQGVVRRAEAPKDTPFPKLDHTRAGKTLTPDQAEAAKVLCAPIGGDAFGATLLKGVTGSGKTEVYLEAVAAALSHGKQALVLLPEIALTSEFITRVEARFGVRPAEWHSGVTMTERRRVWKMVGTGQAQLVVGARSALFLPFQNLGLIVIDEEHDGSYKQEDGVLYHARDMAVLRASFEGAQIVLASATPSLETWSNAENGKYARVDLKARFGVAVLPDMAAIDMRDEELPRNEWISPTLRRAITARIEAGEQSLLFINRRGYAPVTVCRACGHQVGCDFCDARMVEHRFQNRLMCHQCGETKPVPETCPSCEVEGKLAPVGPGIERLAEEAEAHFPDAKIVVLSSDLFGSARALKARIAEIARGEADIVIGTQLVAKGHNFPNLTLVGVIDADLGLQGSDLRAAERTFQLMRQVAGRAGRAEKRGVALLQTYQPDHPVIRATIGGDEEGFWSAEAGERKHAHMPPFGRMAGMILSSENADAVNAYGRDLARNRMALTEAGIEVFGPAPAPIAKVRNRFRVRLLVRGPKGVALQAALKRWTENTPPPRSVRLAIDIDPQNFF